MAGKEISDDILFQELSRSELYTEHNFLFFNKPYLKTFCIQGGGEYMTEKLLGV